MLLREPDIFFEDFSPWRRLPSIKDVMLVFLNGRLVPEEQAVVSVFDRGFLYGDGLFETMLVNGGTPFRWAQHLERLRCGAKFLHIKMPFTDDALRNFAGDLIIKNKMPNALLRLTLSRGVGIRGYSPKGAETPTLVMSMHPAPDLLRVAAGGYPSSPAWRLITSSFRLPANEPLAQFKTCNKLAQIMARSEADARGADEALLLNTDGFVVEASSSNLFWIEDEVVCTSPLTSGILAGVTRAVVLELCVSLGIESREREIAAEELRRTDGVFVSLSSCGIVPALSLDGVALNQSVLVEKLRSTYWQLVQSGTA
jgi:aminodeoxychorismate lyase